MKKTALLLEYLATHPTHEKLFIDLISFLVKNFPKEAYTLLSSAIRKKAVQGNNQDFFTKFIRELSNKDLELSLFLESCFRSEKKLMSFMLVGWEKEVFSRRDDPLAILDFLVDSNIDVEKNYLLGNYWNCTAFCFRKGLLSEKYKQLNVLYKKIFSQSDIIDPSDFPQQKRDQKVFIVTAQVIWGTQHSPTLILKKWIEMLFPIFGRITVVISAPEKYFLLNLAGCELVSHYPSGGTQKADFVEIPAHVTSDFFIKQANPAPNDLFLSIGTGNLLFDRIKKDNKLLFPTIIYPLTHTAKYVFSGLKHAEEVFCVENLNGNIVSVVPLSGVTFVPLENTSLSNPANRYPQLISKDYISLVVVGNRLDLEMDDSFFKIVENIASIKKVKLFCIGLSSFNFPSISNVTFECQGFQSDLERCLTESDYDFFINPNRDGGAFGAYFALFAGIPVLTLDFGDVFHIMKNYYYMSDTLDFSTFIKNYINDEGFRETIWGIHESIKFDLEKSLASDMTNMLKAFS